MQLSATAKNPGIASLKKVFWWVCAQLGSEYNLCTTVMKPIACAQSEGYDGWVDPCKDFEPGQRWPGATGDDAILEDPEGCAVDLEELSDLTDTTTMDVDPKKDEPKLEDPQDLKLYR